jgi:hypothetical protein
MSKELDKANQEEQQQKEINTDTLVLVDGNSSDSKDCSFNVMDLRSDFVTF